MPCLNRLTILKVILMTYTSQVLLMCLLVISLNLAGSLFRLNVPPSSSSLTALSKGGYHYYFISQHLLNSILHATYKNL